MASRVSAVVVLPEHTGDPAVMRFLLCAPETPGDALRGELVAALGELGGVEQAGPAPEKNALWVRRAPAAEWRELGPRVIDLLEEWLRRQLPLRSAAAGPANLLGRSTPASTSDVELMRRVLGVFESEVQPYVATHGGQIELVAVRAGRALVRFRGACAGCPGASATLREHVSVCVRAAVPEITGIDVASAGA
jgi:Fe-S cluster biogenesis protein NfuA